MKHKILIIEDNHDVRENLSEILELSGYDTVLAGNGKEGVQAALREAPDLILCDIMMPELDGYGVLRILAKNPSTSSIPFVFLTAKTEMSDMRKGMTLGADDYITKPFDDVQLLDTIEIRLKKKVSLQTETRNYSPLTSDLVWNLFPQNFHEGEIRFIHKKDLLFTEGQTCRFIYLVRSGRAVGTKADEFSKEVITRIYQHPDVIGLASALTGQRYQETVRAFEDLEVMPVKKDDFLQFIINDKSISFFYLSLLGRELIKADERLLLQAYSPVRTKLASVLTELYEYYHENGRAVIAIPREELASMAGTAKETIIRCLSEFKDEGLVTISGTDIIIEDIQPLLDLHY